MSEKHSITLAFSDDYNDHLTCLRVRLSKASNAQVVEAALLFYLTVIKYMDAHPKKDLCLFDFERDTYIKLKRPIP